MLSTHDFSNEAGASRKSGKLLQSLSHLLPRPRSHTGAGPPEFPLSTSSPRNCYFNITDMRSVARVLSAWKVIEIVLGLPTWSSDEGVQTNGSPFLLLDAPFQLERIDLLSHSYL